MTTREISKKVWEKFKDLPGLKDCSITIHTVITERAQIIENLSASVELQDYDIFTSPFKHPISEEGFKSLLEELEEKKQDYLNRFEPA